MKTSYILKSKKNPKVDADYDAFCLPFKGREILGVHMIGINDFEKPERLYFMADFASIPQYDFINIDLTFPVMSKKMLQTLLKISNFKYDTIPVTMIDDSYLDNPFDKQGLLKPGVPVNEDYYAVQMKEFADVFDYEKSEYEKDIVFPEEVGYIHKLVLKEPECGLPSLFKIKESMDKLFVSSESKEYLEKAGIYGCVFEPVEIN